MSLAVNDSVDPWKSASENLQISGVFPLTEFSRLSSALSDDQGEVTAGLTFDRNQDGRPVLKAELGGCLTVQCQRCLQDMSVTVEHAFQLIFVRPGRPNDEVHSLYDTIEVADGSDVNLSELIEDELLLLLPQVPMHDDPVCEIETEFGDEQSEHTGDVSAEKENPFAVLADLKDKLPKS